MVRVCCGQLLHIQLVFLALLAPGVSTLCKGSSPCVVIDGVNTYNNSEIFRTAVGCTKSLSVVFGGNSNESAPTVRMCQRKQSGDCIMKPGVILTDFQRNCCEVPYPPDQGLPMDVYQCMELTSDQNANGQTNVTLRFMAPFQSDLQSQGQVERCSTCLRDGEGLAMLARKHGTHWTQLYTSNPDIEGNPDRVSVGQLVRLGMIYRVKENDTFMSIALKFGVSVNQIFHWNKHLVPLPDTGGTVDDNGLSRDLPPGLDICILPKTCLSSFGNKQPLNFLEESSPTGQGGWWSDSPMVDVNEFEVGIPEGGIPQW